MDCAPTIDLQFRAPLITSIFLPRKNFLMWACGWVWRRSPGRHSMASWPPPLPSGAPRDQHVSPALPPCFVRTGARRNGVAVPVLDPHAARQPRGRGLPPQHGPRAAPAARPPAPQHRPPPRRPTGGLARPRVACGRPPPERRPAVERGLGPTGGAGPRARRPAVESGRGGRRVAGGGGAAPRGRVGAVARGDEGADAAVRRRVCGRVPVGDNEGPGHAVQWAGVWVKKVPSEWVVGPRPPSVGSFLESQL